MNTAVALLSPLHLGHFAFLRLRLVPRAPAQHRLVASMQIECTVVNYLYSYELRVRIHKVGIQVGPSTKRGRNVLTLYDRCVAGWILHFVQDDK
jgi:hypothetical protein